MIKAKKTKSPNKDTIIQQLTVTQIRRASQDIDSWRSAIRSAESVYFPKRTALYDLYSEILLDGHLTAVVEKRKLSIINSPLVFIEEGIVNEEITSLTSSEDFMNILSYIIESRFWGHSLIELLFDNGSLTPVLIPRKHVIPELGIIVRYQTELTGFGYREYPYTNYLLEVGEKDNLGLLMKAAQYVIYKRGCFGDWAQYSELFGTPFRIAKYDGYDDKTRSDLENALKQAGSAAYVVIPKEADLNFIQNNTQGSAILYEMLVTTCNHELSKLFLGQTMTTEAGGSMAQAKVHQEVERQIHFADKLFVKNVLNDKLKPLLQMHGYNIGKGKFIFLEKENIDKQIKLDMDLKLADRIKIDDSYFYENYDIPLPKTSMN